MVFWVGEWEGDLLMSLLLVAACGTRRMPASLYMFSRTAADATRTSSGILGIAAGVVGEWFEATQAPQSKSISKRPDVADLSSSLVGERSFFGRTTREVSCFGSVSMLNSLTMEKLSHGLFSMVRWSKSEKSAEYPVELGTADIDILSNFWACSVRKAFFLRKSAVSIV